MISYELRTATGKGVFKYEHEHRARQERDRLAKDPRRAPLSIWRIVSTEEFVA